MKKIIILLTLVLFSGCLHYNPHTVPVNSSFQFSPEQYEILGAEVIGEVSTAYFFGFVKVTEACDTGIVAAYSKALSKSPGANILLNVKTDICKTNLYIYSYYSVRVSGIPARLTSKK